MVKEIVNMIENILNSLALLSIHGLILFLVVYMSRVIPVTNNTELCKQNLNRIIHVNAIGASAYRITNKINETKTKSSQTINKY
jgi:hypothetical protein